MYYRAVVHYCASAQKNLTVIQWEKAQVEAVELHLVSVDAGTHHLRSVNERFQFSRHVRKELQEAILIHVIKVNSILERIRILKRCVLKSLNIHRVGKGFKN